MLTCLLLSPCVVSGGGRGRQRAQHHWPVGPHCGGAQGYATGAQPGRVGEEAGPRPTTAGHRPLPARRRVRDFGLFNLTIRRRRVGPPDKNEAACMPILRRASKTPVGAKAGGARSEWQAPLHLSHANCMAAGKEADGAPM